MSGSPTADMRSALVEEFAERAPIMIATESAAEGVNLQFCSLVVNYDLPWNPQRELKNIEAEIREAKKAKRLAADLQSKIAAQKLVNELEQKRNHKKRSLFDAQDEIEQRKDSLIGEVEARLQQRTTRQEIFTLQWRVR